MEFIVNCITDQGKFKDENEDSLCVLEADSPVGTVLMAVVCDGMGGLAKGELASGEVVRMFSDWFQEQLPLLLEPFQIEQLKQSWKNVVIRVNEKVREYGIREQIRLGTTITAMLFLENSYVFVLHVGDSRAYELKENIKQLTKDQTVANLALEMKMISKEEARKDKRRNILLQCVGDTKELNVDVQTHGIKHDCTYLLCSDGFYHEIYPDEMMKSFGAKRLEDERKIKEELQRIVSNCRMRGERDNISAIVIRTA